MSKQATRMMKWLEQWPATLEMLDGADEQELSPESAELLAALLALAED